MKKFETIQEAADYAVLKMVEQGGRCVDEYGACIYKSCESHCAIGHLVCDSENLYVDGSVCGAIDEFSDSVNYELIKGNLRFFTKLQCFHDVGAKTKSRDLLSELSNFIDTSKQQYKQWVEMV